MMRLLALLFTSATLLFAMPAVAAQEVSSLPEIKPFRSAKVEFAFTRKQQVILVGVGVIGGDRKHVVIEQYDPETVLEAVTIADRVYLRVNDNARWLATNSDPRSIPGDAPDLARIQEIDELEAVSLVGDADVNGVSTTQYQARLRPKAPQPEATEEEADTYTIDLFIGKSDGYLHKFQVTQPNGFGEFNDGRFQAAFVYSGFDEEVAINPPPSRLVDELGVSASSQD